MTAARSLLKDEPGAPKDRLGPRRRLGGGGMGPQVPMMAVARHVPALLQLDLFGAHVEVWPARRASSVRRKQGAAAAATREARR